MGHALISFWILYLIPIHCFILVLVWYYYCIILQDFQPVWYWYCIARKKPVLFIIAGGCHGGPGWRGKQKLPTRKKASSNCWLEATSKKDMSSSKGDTSNLPMEGDKRILQNHEKESDSEINENEGRKTFWWKVFNFSKTLSWQQYRPLYQM